MQLSAQEEGLRWLEQAEADADAGRSLLASGHYFMVCFVAQQSAEKALKAYLYAQGEDRVTGHSVERLSAWCAQYDAEFAGVRERVSLLDGYYIPTRYPNGLPDSIPARVYARDVAKDALRRAEIVLECVRDRLRSAPDTR